MNQELIEAPRSSTTDMVTVIRELSLRPDVDVAKLEKMIELQERILRHEAEAAFNEAFALLQPEMPTVAERGRSATGSYARLEDIVPAVKPMLAKYGFAISHRTEFDGNQIRVIGSLRHRSGHSIESEFQSVGDNSGSKNSIQGIGSVITYGRRYTTCSLLFIATADDTDARSEPTQEPPAPAGFDDWFTDLAAAADNGTVELEKAWAKSKAVFKNYLHNHKRAGWAAIKLKASRVQP